MNTQDTFKFAETHEWADLKADGLVWAGVSNHAQEALGDVMFFQAPKIGQQVQQAAPELVNEKPYEVWLFKIKPNSEEALLAELKQLMGIDQYKASAGA